MVRNVFLIFLFLIIQIPIYGGIPDSAKLVSITKSVDSDEKFSSLIIGFDYSNNATTDSRLNNLVNQASFYPYLSFYGKHGVYLNGGFNYIANSDSSLSKSTYSIDLVLGYDIKIGKKLTITPSYSHIFYDSHTMLLNKLYADYIDLSATIEIGNWNSVFSANYKWGKIEDWNFSVKTSYAISIEKIFTKKDLIIIQPGVSVCFNNPNYYTKLFSFLNEYIKTHPNAGLARLVYDIYHISDQSPELVNLRHKLLANKDLAYMIRDYLPTGMPLS